MATIGEVDAKAHEKEDASETKDKKIEIYFGVFFDGTSNNMIQKENAKRIKEKLRRKNKDEFDLIDSSKNDFGFKNGANQLRDTGQLNGSKGYSNIAILHSIYKGTSSEDGKNSKIYKYNIYVEGAGTDFIHNELDTSEENWDITYPIDFIQNIAEKTTTANGSIMGRGKTGVVSLVSKALEMVRIRSNAIFEGIKETDIKSESEIHFDVFGFSRGAACARLFSYCVASPDKVNGKDGIELDCIKTFKRYNYKNTIDDRRMLFLDELGLKREHIVVDVLGIFDTVSSIGFFSVDSYKDNTTEYGLMSPQEERVKHTLHLCALDEFRAHFGLTDIGKKPKSNNLEVFLPGCHSDVGGGYIECLENYTISSPEKYRIPKEDITIKDDNTVSLYDYFKSYGWLEDDKGINETGDIDIIRQSKQGYSNIPLDIMQEYANKKSKRTVFGIIPKAFQPKADIEKLFWSNKLRNKYELIEKQGRLFYYPGGAYNSQQYKKLRKYLHFSANDKIGFDMSFEENNNNDENHEEFNVIRRYVYHGDKGDDKRHFLYVYKGENNEKDEEIKN